MFDWNMALIGLLAPTILKEYEEVICKENIPLFLTTYLKQERLTFSPVYKTIALQYLTDLYLSDGMDYGSPFPAQSSAYKTAYDALLRTQRFQKGDFAVYKKKRTKRLELKSYHKKHHPNSDPTPPYPPWNVFLKEVRSKLTCAENNHIDDDSLYCCWEECWTLQETIDECKDAFELKQQLRC